MTRFLTRGQYVAWRGLQLLGRVLLFGALAFLFFSALATILEDIPK